MSAINPVYLTEDPTHDAIIQTINDEAFGPGRHARAAERVREQGPHDRSLSFVATVEGEVIASVRMTPIIAGSVNGHMLGPLAVRPDFKKLGIGRELVRIAVMAAKKKGGEAVILIGDPPYYQPLGFKPVTAKLAFPGPVDPARILVATDRENIDSRLGGPVKWRSDAGAEAFEEIHHRKGAA
jgi:predicted N-acetyltransferase YhbS